VEHLLAFLYDVRVKSSRASRVERQLDIMRLHAARYRWVNLLWISVVSVAVTERCFVWDLPLCVILSVVCEICSLEKSDLK